MNNQAQPQPNAGGFGAFARRYWPVGAGLLGLLLVGGLILGSTCDSYDRKTDRTEAQGQYLGARSKELGKSNSLGHLLDGAQETRDAYRDGGGK